MAEENRLNPQYVVLPEGASRVLGRDALRTNIAIGVAVANIIKTTLGPKGMDKMLISDLGDIIITNDGATILNEMNLEHPVAKILVEIAKTQDKEVGDGTTSVVVIAGNLLKEAGDLIEKGVHPINIIAGYKLATARALEVLKDLTNKISIEDTDKLVKVGMVTLASKNIGDDKVKERLVKEVISAIKQVMEKVDNKIIVDKDRIKLEKKVGGSIEDTKYINGIVIDKEVAHPNMPKRIENAKIALLDYALEIKKTEAEERIEITSPDQIKKFLEQEQEMLKEMADKLKEVGANVVFTQKGIDDVAQHFLAKYGIMAVRRVKKSDMEALARATGGKIVTTIDDLSKNDLGFAGLVEERKIGNEAMVFVEKCKDPKSVSILIRASSQQALDEAERALTDLIGALTALVEDRGDGYSGYVYGGGATYLEIARKLEEYAKEIPGKEQLAVKAYANALKSIAATLAENSGADSVSLLVELENKHTQKNGAVYGVDVANSSIGNMSEIGVIEPARVVRQVLISAGEAVVIILRIDDMISAKGTKSSSSNPSENPEPE